LRRIEAGGASARCTPTKRPERSHPASFDSRRELAIQVRDENLHPLDLSDAGSLGDLEDRYAEARSWTRKHEKHDHEKIR
jgi:hypothetical protein